MKNIKYTHKFNNLNDAIAHINKTPVTHTDYKNRFEQITNAEYNYETHLKNLAKIEAETETGEIECFYIVREYKNMYYGTTENWHDKYEEVEVIYVKRKYDINIVSKLRTLGGGGIDNSALRVFNEIAGEFLFLGNLAKENRSEFQKILKVFPNSVVI